MNVSEIRAWALRARGENAPSLALKASTSNSHPFSFSSISLLSSIQCHSLVEFIITYYLIFSIAYNLLCWPYNPNVIMIVVSLDLSANRSFHIFYYIFFFSIYRLLRKSLAISLSAYRRLDAFYYYNTLGTTQTIHISIYRRYINL